MLLKFFLGFASPAPSIKAGIYSAKPFLKVILIRFLDKWLIKVDFFAVNDYIIFSTEVK